MFMKLDPVFYIYEFLCNKLLDQKKTFASKDISSLFSKLAKSSILINLISNFSRIAIKRMSQKGHKLIPKQKLHTYFIQNFGSTDFRLKTF